MKRREFLKKTSCGAAGFAAFPMAQATDEKGKEVVLRCPDPTEAGIVVKITRTFKDKRTVKL